MFPIADFWPFLFETVDVQGRAVVAWSTPFWDLRLLQKRWLDAWSQAADGYLRSAAFLEYMRHSMSDPVEPTEKLASLDGTVEGGPLP